MRLIQPTGVVDHLLRSLAAESQLAALDQRDMGRHFQRFAKLMSRENDGPSVGVRVRKQRLQYAQSRDRRAP